MATTLTAILVVLFLALLTLLLLLNVFGLPGNWLILGLVGLWSWFAPEFSPGALFWAGLVAMAILGEVLETVAQIVKARKHGCSSAGTFAGMIGAVAGAILMAPLLWGMGAFIGAVGGGGVGCYLVETLRGKAPEAAWRAALGTMTGRCLGTLGKIGAGAVMVAMTGHALWPTSSSVSLAIFQVPRPL